MLNSSQQDRCLLRHPLDLLLMKLIGSCTKVVWSRPHSVLVLGPPGRDSSADQCKMLPVTDPEQPIWSYKQSTSVAVFTGFECMQEEPNCAPRLELNHPNHWKLVFLYWQMFGILHLSIYSLTVNQQQKMSPPALLIPMRTEYLRQMKGLISFATITNQHAIILPFWM